jgi:isopenicillin N synthase-like dioxygenase
MDGSWTNTPSHSTLPVVDISGLSGDAGDRAAVARDIRNACLDSGFFYLAGHGIPMDELARVFAQSRRFFDLPLAEKNAIALPRSRCNRGYEPLRAQVLEAGTPPDVKEGFYIGRDLPEDDPRVMAGWFNHGPNLWPEGLPEFRATMTAYVARLTDLACRVMEGLALSLGLEANHFKISAPSPWSCCACCIIRRNRPTRCPTKRAAAPIPIGAA